MQFFACTHSDRWRIESVAPTGCRGARTRLVQCYVSIHLFVGGMCSHQNVQLGTGERNKTRTHNLIGLTNRVHQFTGERRRDRSKQLFLHNYVFSKSSFLLSNSVSCGSQATKCTMALHYQASSPRWSYASRLLLSVVLLAVSHHFSIAFGWPLLVNCFHRCLRLLACSCA